MKTSNLLVVGSNTYYFADKSSISYKKNQEHAFFSVCTGMA